MKDKKLNQYNPPNKSKQKCTPQKNHLSFKKNKTNQIKTKPKKKTNKQNQKKKKKKKTN